MEPVKLSYFATGIRGWRRYASGKERGFLGEAGTANVWKC